MKTITLKVSDEEAVAWKVKACGSLSKFIRETVNEKCNGVQVPVLPARPLSQVVADTEAKLTTLMTKPGSAAWCPRCVRMGAASCPECLALEEKRAASSGETFEHLL